MRSFTILLVALSVSALSLAIFTVPLTRRHGTGAYLKEALDANHARIASLKYRKSNGTVTAPVINQGYTTYIASVGIGNPPTYYDLLIDSGSSNTFCGTGTPYRRTSTSIPTGESVAVSYVTGNFSGLEYLDQVALAPNLVITNQSIGDALSSQSFDGVDGILGVGPADLTWGTVSQDSEIVPTVLNNLALQKLIEKQILGIYFAPATTFTEENGALTYGGADSSLYEGDVMYAPLTETSPASGYWGINATCTYGDHAIIPTSAAGIFDTGTTQVLLADNFLSVYVNAIPGAVFESGLIKIPKTSVSSMHPLNFVIGGHLTPMSVASQLVPEAQTQYWDGGDNSRWSVISSMGSPSGEGLDFILGEKFMERYYTVFDTDANRVGFARTNVTSAN